MPRPLRSILLAALVAALLPGAALAQPVKVQLPKGAQKAPREKPLTVNTDEVKKGPDRKALSAHGLFMLDFDKVDIDKLVQTISDMTGKLFILPENIRGKITILGPEHGKQGVTADEAYAAFLAALDANGLTVYPVGKYLKIVEKRAGKQNNIPTVLDEDAAFSTNEQMMTKLFKLHYVDAEPVRGVIQQLVSRDGDTIAFPPDTIIVNDIGLNMHRLSRIIDRLDRPSTSDEIRVVQVQYAAAADIAEKLRQLFDDKNRKPGQRPGNATVAGQPPPAPESAPAALSQLLADERTNKLIIVANENAYRRIEELLKQLDQPIAGEGQVHVYYLENANAEELSSTLASLTQGINKGGGGGARPANAPGAPAGAANAPKGPQTVADLFSGEIKITADKSTNSLVIIANKTDYRNLVNVIKQLDIARRQVFVEAVIMEVNLDNDTQFGISVHGGSQVTAKNPNDSLAVLGSQSPGLSSIGGVTSLASMSGFLAGLQGPMLSVGGLSIPSFAVVLNALQKSSDVNVLSTPHILTSDNEEAEISVGQNVPFQAGVTSPLLSGLANTAGAAGAAGGLNGGLATTALLGSYGGLIAPIQRQNVELKLKIKPQINESDFIRLQIDEQTEEIASTDPTLGPTTAKRAAKTTVVARDQQTVVIGGLIQERHVRSVNKTPILGDIPVLGWLFRKTDTHKTKTNLLLILTPYIIRDQADFRRIFERKMKERQEFVEQFYGRQTGYKVPIDYTRKSGPLAKMFKTLDTEAQRAENGGPGVTGEKAIRPKTEAQPAQQKIPAGPDANNATNNAATGTPNAAPAAPGKNEIPDQTPSSPPPKAAPVAPPVEPNAPDRQPQQPPPPPSGGDIPIGEPPAGPEAD